MTPEGLSDEARAIWAMLESRFDLEDHHRVLLRTALDAWDTLQTAQRQIETEGLTFRTEATGAVHLHPALKVVKESRSGFLQSWRMLNLDTDAPRPDALTEVLRFANS